MVGGPSLTRVTLTLPACETVNVRNAAPLAGSVLAKVSVVGDVGVGAAGEEVVLLLPHAALSNAKATAATTALGHKPCLANGRRDPTFPFWPSRMRPPCGAITVAEPSGDAPWKIASTSTF
jgi:hypothetical protein